MADLSEFEGQPWSRTSAVQHPKGWEPGIDVAGRQGTLTVALEHEPTSAIWRELIADWGFDPKTTSIVGPVQVRGWDANVGGGEIKRMRYYRASLEMRATADERADMDEVAAIIEKRKPVKMVPFGDLGDVALIVNLADWQVGNGEGGGTPAFLERLGRKIDALVAHIKMLNRLGYKIAGIFLMGLGDLSENCQGFYSQMTFSIDLDQREQVRTVRHQLVKIVDRLVPFGIPMTLGGVAGNHGENRNGSGKSFTSFSDNSDLAVIEQVGEILAVNPDRYGHVDITPAVSLAHDLTLTLDVCGVPVGWMHGHQVKGSGGVVGWWKGQQLGRQTIADVQILNSGHLHHFVCDESTSRTHFQAPALDGGSRWFTDMTGKHSPPGMLTYLAGNGCGDRGWSNLAIL